MSPRTSLDPVTFQATDAERKSAPTYQRLSKQSLGFLEISLWLKQCPLHHPRHHLFLGAVLVCHSQIRVAFLCQAFAAATDPVASDVGKFMKDSSPKFEALNMAMDQYL